MSSAQGTRLALMPRGASLCLGAAWLFQGISSSLAAPLLSKSCAHKGFGYDDADHPHLNGGYVADQSVCQQTCRNTWYCEVFTYFENSKACWLHGSKAVARPMSHAFSAERWCDLSKASEDSADFRQILTVAHEAALKAEKEGMGLAEQLVAAATATKAAMAENMKGAEPEILPLVSGQVAADYASRLGKGVRAAVLEAATATLHAAKEQGLSDKEQEKLAAKSAAIAASSEMKDLHLATEKAAQEAAWAAQSAIEKLGFDVDRQAIAAVSAASSVTVSQLRRKGKPPVVQAVEAAEAARSAAAGAAQDVTRQTRIAIDVAIAVASDGMRQQGYSSSAQAEAAADAVRQVAEIVGMSMEQQQQESDAAVLKVKSMIDELGKRAQVAVQPWEALGMPHSGQEPSLRPSQPQLLGAAPSSQLPGAGHQLQLLGAAPPSQLPGAGPASLENLVPECAKAGIAYLDPDYPTLNGGVVDNPQHCQVSCSLSWFCESFTFYQKTKQCWLLGIKAVAKPDMDAISGPQVCGTSSKAEAAAKAITQSALDAVEKSFASGGFVDPGLALNRAATAARDAASASGLTDERRWNEVARAVGAAAARIAEHNGQTIDQQARAAAKAAESVAKSHLMAADTQLQLAVETASAAAAKAAGTAEDGMMAIIKAARDTAAAMGVSLQEQTDLAVEAAARVAGQTAKDLGDSHKAQMKAVADAAAAAAKSLGLALPRAKEVAATATSSAYMASKDFSSRDPIQLAIKTLGFAPDSAPACSMAGTAFHDENHPDVNGGYVDSANQCQATCQTVWYCEVFTYNLTSKACHLLGDRATASPAEHVISGPVKCTGQRLMLNFGNIHDAMRSMSNAALQAAQEARLAGEGLTQQLEAAKKSVESFTAEAGFSRSDQVQMASVAVGQCAARAAKEAGLDVESQLHAATHAARKAAQEAGMTEQEQWQQVATAAAATTLSLSTAATREERSHEAQLAAEEVVKWSPFPPEVQVAQAAQAVQIAMAFTGSQTSELPVVASQAARQVAKAMHLPEASLSALEEEAMQEARDIQKHFESMVDHSVAVKTVKKDIMPGLAPFAKAQMDEKVLESAPSYGDARIAQKVETASEFGKLHDVISHAIDGTTDAEIKARDEARAAAASMVAKDELKLGSGSGNPRLGTSATATGLSAETNRSFMWCTALVIMGLLLFGGLVWAIFEAGKGWKRHKKKKMTRSGSSLGSEDSDSDLLLYADEAPGRFARGPVEVRAPPRMPQTSALPQAVHSSQGMASPGSGYRQYQMPPNAHQQGPVYA